ncbi:50S ribosomal protein L25 [Candidatus Saccharibacteria bacterium]|nr:50S ribosomal protein L25 [Candidatus Saccharibacteria bacterium]
MSDYNLSLSVRTETGKKSLALRESGFIPSVIYGGKTEILAKSPYNDTEKVLRLAGYHSPIDLTIDDKKVLAIVKNVSLDPVSRRITSVSFQKITSRKPVEATTPIVLDDFESSEANKSHLTLSQQLEEIDIKAKPSELPKDLHADASKLATLEDKILVKDLILPKGVEFANKDQNLDQIVANLYDAAAEAAAREEAEAKEEPIDAADVPSDNGTKPEEPSETKENEE